MSRETPSGRSGTHLGNEDSAQSVCNTRVDSNKFKNQLTILWVDVIDLNLQIFLEFVDIKSVVKAQRGENSMVVKTSGLQTNIDGTSMSIQPL
jgi:hypothetical protein